MNNYERATQEVRNAFNALFSRRIEAAVKAEREACAQVCEDSNDMCSSYGLAKAIRARGEASLRSNT